MNDDINTYVGSQPAIKGKWRIMTPGRPQGLTDITTLMLEHLFY